MKRLWIITDGLGYSQLDHFRPAFIWGLGHSRGLHPVPTLLAYSSGIYPAIWTGKYPDELGVWCEFLRRDDAQFKRSVFSALPTLRLQRSAQYVWHRLLSKCGIAPSGHYAIPPALSGIFSALGTRYARMPPLDLDSELLTTQLQTVGVEWSFRFTTEFVRIDPDPIVDDLRRHDLAIVLVADTDAVGHQVGPFTPAFGRFMRLLDKSVERLVRAVEGEFGDLEVIMFSDHGMSATREGVDLIEVLRRRGLRLRHDYVAFLNATTASIWIEREGVGDRLRNAINDDLRVRILDGVEVRELHLDFRGRHYGDMLALADVGVQLVPNFISLERGPVAGMHGYHPSEATTFAYMIGGGEAARDVVDIHRVLLQRVGL